MEVLASVGIAAKEVFEYNRAMYSFDQTQRLDRDLLRLEMQVKRFELFREDIRDLVELTVGKMEMYHLVGALFLEFCATMYVEGRIQKNKAPSFLLSLYWLSVAGAWIYLMLAVILSLYASISAHAFGVRLLTRFVRLPIPGAGQMDSMNARFTELERQGVGNVMRVPFMQGAQRWQQRGAGGPALEVSRRDSEWRGLLGDLEDPRRAGMAGGAQPKALLGTPEPPLADPCKNPIMRPGQHVQIFRELQTKWQRYDAYARVCMSLGAGQTLMSLSFWIISLCFIQYEVRSPIACVALCLILQLTAMAVMKLDVGYIRLGWLCLIQSAGTASVFLAVYILWNARRLPCVVNAEGKTLCQSSDVEHNMGDLDMTQLYRESPICMFLMAVWLQALLFTASPHGENGLPTRFRTVLFLDVFKAADTISGQKSKRNQFQLFGRRVADTLVPSLCSTRPGSADVLERVTYAYEALEKAEAALRRWKAALRRWREVPSKDAPEARIIAARIDQLWTTCMASRRALFEEAMAVAKATGDGSIAARVKKHLKPDTRAWHELSAADQRDGQFAFTLLGPFERWTTTRERYWYWYDLENEEFMWQNSEGRGVLEIDHVATFTREAERAVQGAVRGLPCRAAEEKQESEEEEEPPDAAGSYSGASLPRSGGSGETGTSLRDAVAKDAKKRGSLPWRALRNATTALQFAWVLTGVMMLLENKGIWQAGYRMGFTADAEPYAPTPHSVAALGHGANSDELAMEPAEAAEAWPIPRRLSAPRARASERWHALAVDAAWPAGASWPAAVASLQEVAWGSASGGGPQLLVASASGELYVGQLGRSFRPRLEDVQALPPGAAILCGGSGAAPVVGGTPRCLLGTPAQHGVALWPLGGPRSEGVLLPLAAGAAPWLRFGGSAIRCAEAAQLAAGFGTPREEWCLLLVGWDGSRLPVALVPLPHGPGRPPAPGTEVEPMVDAPMATPLAQQVAPSRPAASPAQCSAEGVAEAPAVAALHVGSRGRLWALWTTGTLQAWELLEPRPIGRWRPDWRRARGLAPGWRPASLCERQEADQLLVAGSGDGGVVQLLLVTPPWGALAR